MSKHGQSFDERIRAKFAHVERERSDMHPYQVEACQFLKDNPFSAGFLDLGLGKSVTAGTLICDLLADFETEKVLVVGPIAVIATSWPDEFRTWRHMAAFNFTVIREDDDDPRLKAARRVARVRGENESAAETAERRKIREELARDPASIHLINIEALEWLVEFWGRDWPYRTVIVDESQKLKDHTSNRFKALMKVRMTPGYITRLHILTATPASESYIGLFAQIALCDRGERFGTELGKFRDRYFTENKWARTWKLRPGGEEDILAKIADICLVMKRADYYKVDAASIVRRHVTLTPKQMGQYQTMATDFVLQLDDGTEIEAENAAALSQKLSQMASGVLYETYLDEPLEDDGDMVKVRKVHPIHEQKIDMLREIVDELDGQNLLVAYQHRSSLDRLQKAFPKASKWDKAGKSKEPWNKGKIPMLLMHPKSGGVGQNLQKGGNTIVFFDIPWSLEDFKQLIGRLDRQGQTKHVTVFLLTATGTIDERIAKALETKDCSQEELFAILKRLIRRYRKLKTETV